MLLYTFQYCIHRLLVGIMISFCYSFICIISTNIITRIEHNRFGHQYMPRVLKVLEIIEIWTCHIFKLFRPPKMTSTLIKRPAEHDGDGNNNKVYLDITSNFYPLVYIIIRLDGL